MTRDEIPRYTHLSLNPWRSETHDSIQSYIYIVLKYRGYPDRTALFHYSMIMLPLIGVRTVKDYRAIVDYTYDDAMAKLVKCVEDTYPQGLDDLVSVPPQPDYNIIERLRREGIIG